MIACSTARWLWLLGCLLEKIVELRARVIRVARSRSIRRIESRAVAIAVAISVPVCIAVTVPVRWPGRGVSHDGHTRLEQFASVSRVFRRYARRHRFQALEARGRLKVRALFAAVQSHMTLGTRLHPVGFRRQSCRTVIAADRRRRLHQARQARACHIDGRARTLRTRTILASAAVAGIITR